MYEGCIVGEYGLVENVTLLVLAVAVITGLRLMRDVSSEPHWLRYWLILLVLGAFFPRRGGQLASRIGSVNALFLKVEKYQGHRK